MASVITVPADVAEARLPEKYQTARNAIAECDRIDECKTWSDKAAALASYARQAKDDSLRVMAVRIQARAERRCGELLKQIPSGSAGNLVQHRKDGTVPSVTRESAASDAGLSERQRKTALRLASIPEADFNRQMDAPSPPTITELAAQGTIRRAQDSLSQHSAIQSCQAIIRFAEFCTSSDPRSLAEALDPIGAQSLRRCVELADRWLDRFVAHLPSNARE